MWNADKNSYDMWQLKQSMVSPWCRQCVLLRWSKQITNLWCSCHQLPNDHLRYIPTLGAHPPYIKAIQCAQRPPTMNVRMPCLPAVILIIQLRQCSDWLWYNLSFISLQHCRAISLHCCHYPVYAADGSRQSASAQLTTSTLNGQRRQRTMQ